MKVAYPAGRLAGAAVLVGLAASVQAQDRPLVFRVGIATAWDSNVFRLPSSAPDPLAAQGVAGKSDRSTTVNAGVKFEQPVSQQRFSLDVNAAATRFAKFDTLDRETSGYSGAWSWVLTPRLRGNLSMSRSQSAVEQEDTQGLRSAIVRTTRSQDASAEARITSHWYLLAGLSHTEQKHSQTFTAQPDSRQDSGEVGVRYALPSASSLTLIRRGGSGSQDAVAGAAFNGQGTGFESKETEARANWVVSARSTVLGRLTRTSRHHGQVSERDFSATGADLNWTWSPTGRLTLTTAAQRRADPFLLGTGSTHRVEKALVFSPSWLLTPRLVLRGGLSRRDFEYTADQSGIAGGGRRDSVSSVDAALSWAPYRSVSLTVFLRRDVRTSTDANFSFKGNVVGLNGLLSF